MSKQTITLSMIVKNETHIIKDCLESVAPHIDYWVIADNGSTDGTQEFVKNFFKEKGIPGELHEVEWVDFGHNRSEALALCKGKADYVLMIDADDQLLGTPKIDLKEEKDGYALRIKRGNFTWWRNQIFKVDSGWTYQGVLHEYAECTGKEGKDIFLGRIQGEYHIDARTLGARNIDEDGSHIDGVKKYSRDAETLKKALEKEPDNTRYQFYLAQSYFDSQQYEKAEEAYAHRATMGGWLEEVFYSVFRVGMCKMMRKEPWQDCQDVFLQAWNIKPDRSEPLYHLAQIHRTNGNPHLGYLFAKAALDIPYPEKDILFINDDIYNWQVLDEFSATAFYTNDIERGYVATKRLIDMMNDGKIPVQHAERFNQNLEYYQKSINERQEQQKQHLEAQKNMKKNSIKNKENQKRKKLKKKKKQKI